MIVPRDAQASRGTIFFMGGKTAAIAVLQTLVAGALAAWIDSSDSSD
jgi:LytS/YehU family sensor histidine kinase